MQNRILVVEDDLRIQELVVEFLLSQDYKVDSASDGMEGYEKYKNNIYDLVILDVMLPKLDGYGLCKMIRKNNQEISIIFLTALGSEEDEVKGFELEVDDYITKPFSFNILIKRVEAVLKRRREANNLGKLLVFKELKLDLSTYKAYVENEEIELTLKEFNILKMLIEIYPKVAARESLIENIWGYEYYGDTRVIDAHVKNIRKKIRYDYIKTLKGVGYVLGK
ncbi:MULTISPECIES: response regulator transcription factor [Clostridium]|uniref:Stage 0 sporulation protein A homolog n=1 Tax=Clostridium cibarium TaxID=2762247 RepID=A0ABR8PU90_9CLOT|nr:MULTISPECIES: response regulator transcription factor [Clostridium]MBD7911694.1 response regulator transcription factor [Clostridium cibarium]